MYGFTREQGEKVVNCSSRGNMMFEYCTKGVGGSTEYAAESCRMIDVTSKIQDRRKQGEEPLVYEVHTYCYKISSP